jgi:hypothetical protein
MRREVIHLRVSRTGSDLAFAQPAALRQPEGGSLEQASLAAYVRDIHGRGFAGPVCSARVWTIEADDTHRDQRLSMPLRRHRIGQGVQA